MSSNTVDSGLPYEPNTTDYEQFRAVEIMDERPEGLYFRANIEVHAHAIGSKFRGLLGIVTLLRSFKNNRESGADLVTKEPFQVNYAESYESAERRFRPWLEESLVNALTMWRKSL